MQLQGLCSPACFVNEGTIPSFTLTHKARGPTGVLASAALKLVSNVDGLPDIYYVPRNSASSYACSAGFQTYCLVHYVMYILRRVGLYVLCYHPLCCSAIPSYYNTL